MDAVTLKDIAIITTPFFIFALGAGVGAIGYFLKTLHRDINRKFEHAEAKIDRVDHDLMDFKAQLPTRYVLKDDYIRTISVFEQKLDKIGKEIQIFAGRRDGEP